MRSPTRVLSAFSLSAGLIFATVAKAADLPKQGTFSGTYFAFGTYKLTPIGKELFLSVWDENGLSVGNGFLDHLTWHCWGLYDAVKGFAQSNGYCVGTDPDGDQIAGNAASDGRYAADAKSSKSLVTFTTGTGKYTGISGGITTADHTNEFRPAAEGTYLQYASPFQGSYKLP
jgi:hypothetical protein